MMWRRTLSVVAIATALAAGGCWWVYNRYFSERANPSEEIYTIRGIDISAHNGDVDFEALAGSGLSFAYIKATEGTDFRDRNFDRNATGLKRAGIPAGAYHFFRFDTDGEMQALNFLNALKGRRFELPPAIDVEEWANAEGLGTGRIMKELRMMIDVLRRDGYEPMIYTNKDGYERFVKGKLDRNNLWICSFTDPPLDDDREWVLWQFSHRGAVAGIEGPVDLNTVNPSDTIFGKLCRYEQNGVGL